jgi:hypothetical protein
MQKKAACDISTPARLSQMLPCQGRALEMKRCFYLCSASPLSASTLQVGGETFCSGGYVRVFFFLFFHG